MEKTQSISADLLSNIERIADYTAAHAELRAAHHFLYDLRCPPGGRPQYLIMGINPGETDRDWKLSPSPTEETSRYDFHHRAEKAGSALRWATLAKYYLDGADYVLAEVFFWSSRDMRHFVERFGDLRASPHLTFCRDRNLELIEAYRPKAIVLPGLQLTGVCAELYGLSHRRTVHEADVRLIELYTDGHRPWIFTKHWTGAFGMSAAQKDRIRKEIALIATSSSSAGANNDKPIPTTPGTGHRTTGVSALRAAEVSEKLSSCEDWVRREFDRLDGLLKGHASSASDESGPGRRYSRGGPAGWFCRLHPKQGHIAMGFPNAMRGYVEATGLLRSQKEAAWVNYDITHSPRLIGSLIDTALALRSIDAYEQRKGEI